MKALGIKSPLYAGLAVTVLLALFFSVFAFYYLLQPQHTFGWDESHHAFNGLMVAHSLRTADWAMFWSLTNRLIVGWPFLYSWISGVGILLFGTTFNGARIPSLLFFFFSTPLVYLIAFRLDHKKPAIAGCVAALFFASSPLVLYYSVQCMIEIPGVFFLLLLAWCYLKSLESDRIAYPVLGGLSAAVLFFLKYQNAAVFLPIAIDAFIRWRKNGNKSLKPLVIMVVSFCLPVLLWLVISIPAIKIRAFLHTIQESGGHIHISHWTPAERRLFWIRSLATYHAASFGIFIAMVGGLLFSVRRFRRSTGRFIFLFPVFYLIVLSLSHNRQDRYLLPLTPFLFIMAALAVVRLASLFRPGVLRWLYVVLASLFLMGDIHKYPGHYRRLANPQHGSRIAWEPARQDDSILFSLASMPGFLRQPDFYSNPEADYSAPERTFQDVWNYIRDFIFGRGALCSLSYHQEFSPHLQRWYGYVDNIPVFTNWEPRCRFFAALVIDPASVYYTTEGKKFARGRNREWLEFLRNREAVEEIHLAAEKNFRDLKLKVLIFESTALRPNQSNRETAE